MPLSRVGRPNPSPALAAATATGLPLQRACYGYLEATAFNCPLDMQCNDEYIVIQFVSAPLGADGYCSADVGYVGHRL